MALLVAITSRAAALDPAQLTGADVGSPSIAGGTVVTNGTVRLVGAGGAGIGLKGDQFQFASVVLTNDFDLKFRVAALADTDVLARAGLMVRESGDPGAPFVGVFETPTAAGAQFQIRSTTGVNTVQTGGFPPNVPQAWLRLRRVGDSFTGFAGYDGTHWRVLGSNIVSMTNALVGFAVTSHSPNTAAAAVFADLADADGADVVAPVHAEVEPPGPTSRRTALVLSEILYHPARRTDGRNLEFIELYNSQPFFEDISGWRIAGDYDFTFPPNTVIGGGGFLILAPNPADITAVYGLTNVVGGFTNTLSHSGGKVQLLSDRGAVFLEVNYKNQSPWPLAADGAGHSLALVRPSLGENDPHAWAASVRKGGSPGGWEYVDADPRRSVVLNEVLATPAAAGTKPFVELYNHSDVAVNLAGCRLGYDATAPGYVFPAGTQIPSGGFLAVAAEQLGFPLRADATTLFFSAPDGGDVFDAVGFVPAFAGTARGRQADGGAEFYPLSAPTPGAPNAPPRPSELVLSELMYSPPSGDKNLQYVEVHNPGGNAVGLEGWKLAGGIDFTFPSGATLPAGGYLVVARNAARLRTVYTNLTTANCLGNFSGSLAGGGERITLTRTVTITLADTTTQAVDAVVDEVSYRVGGQWGHWAAGGGSSLELVDVHASRRFGANWADSDESAKAVWTLIETTGVLDNGADVADSLHLGLMGEGECLVDNVEVIGPGGTNLVTNGDFEGATQNFSALGNHIRSTLESGSGVNGGNCLHLRASGNLDTGANRVRMKLARNLNVGDTATLRARVRWLRGWPEALLRLHGDYLEAEGRLNVPLNLGTPAAPNSRAVVNAGPGITAVTHFPVLPAAGEPVVVTARVQDPDGLASVTLNWRADPATEYATIAMTDDGTGGDAIAGDGIFSATLPGQPTATLAAYSISAADAATPAAATSVFPAGAPAHECLVRFDEPTAANAFGTYRVWVTKKGTATWTSRPNLSNEPIEGTLVYGGFRAIQGAGFRYSGSPYHQIFSAPTGSAHYVWALPKDDLLLGTDSFNKVHAPGNGPFDDNTIQREQTIYWMGRQIGLPWLYRRYVNVFVNGVKRQTLMEDTQVPGSDLVNSYFPNDSGGDLFKLNPWFEFPNSTSQNLGGNNESWADLNEYTTSDGAKKTARYRWNWQPRAANGTANNYTNLFALVDAANQPDDPNFIAALGGAADMEQWLRTFALNHSAGNWDSFGNRNAQNMYAYKPTLGPWQLFMWDANIVYGNSGSDGPSGDDLFQYNYGDQPMGRIYSTPFFRRTYLRLLGEIANGPMQPGPVGTLIDAKYAAFQAASVSASVGTSLKSWINSRRTYLLNQVGQIKANFDATPQGVVNGATAHNLLVLAGTAPLGVNTIRVNGRDYPLTWTTVTNWSISLILDAATNQFSVQGFDPNGQVFAGASKSLTVRFTGALERAEDKLVFNEIHYRPVTPGAEYVELLNASTNNTFDVSGWRVNGLGYTFPAGTLLTPGRHFLLAADRTAFAAAYDPTRAHLDDAFPGTLNPAGETLQLIRPGATPAQDSVVTAVAYSPLPPWPALAAGGGASLQLIDPSRGEDERVGNWGAVSLRDPNAVAWKFAQGTGVAGSDTTVQLYLSSNPPVTDPLDIVGTFWGTINFGGPSLSSYGVRLHRDGGVLGAEFLVSLTDPTQSLPMTGVTYVSPTVKFGFDAQDYFTGKLAADGSKITGNYVSGTSSTPFAFSRQNPGGDVLVDDISLVAGASAEAGVNLLADGGFESVLSGPWAANGAHAGSQLSPIHPHTGGSALELLASAGGTGDSANAVVQNVAGLVAGQTYTLGFWYLDSTNGSGVMARLGDGSISATAALEPPKDPHNEFTPGYRNSDTAALPAFPDLWLNEVSPNPDAGAAPFAELFNHGTNTLALAGFWLGDGAGNPLRDAFDPGVTLAPGQFLVVTLDGAGSLAHATDLHTSFRPDAANGTLLLTRVAGGATNVVDFVRWKNLAHGHSVGHFPDASPFGDSSFATPTPGAPNSLAVPPLPVFINEWMASNPGPFADPAGGPNSTEFDDWFELFNPNPADANLAGYVLNNAATNRGGFTIPAGYVVPAQGYLLVWADKQTGQNTATNRDLHVSFKLSKGGDTIALLAPNGTVVDAVTFGSQTAGVSEGRAVDGGPGPFVDFFNPTPAGANGAPQPTAPVLDTPRFSAAGDVVLRWSVEAARSYQVRFKDNLAADWQPLGAPQTAANPGSLTVTDAAPAAGDRYYEVIVVQ